MTDRDVLKTLEKKVGRPFAYTLEGDCCVELDLTSQDYLYHGLIRRHSADEKREIMELVSCLSGLRKLNLRRNKLFHLPESFQNLVEMEHLTLGSNYLGSVPKEIRGFKRLKYLHLGNGAISELPSWMGDFAQLEYLTLHKNLGLRSIDALAGQKSLKALNLYLISFGALPKLIYDLSNLETLTVWNMKDLSDDISKLKNLEFFTGCGTQGLRTLPDGFTKLKKLRMTRLYQNALERLPDNFGDLDNLEQISLYQNNLSQLPESMANLRKLAKLNLGWNSFKTLPPWLNQMTSLQWLALFENPLADSDSITFPAATQVLREWPFTTLCN